MSTCKGVGRERQRDNGDQELNLYVTLYSKVTSNVLKINTRLKIVKLL